MTPPHIPGQPPVAAPSADRPATLFLLARAGDPEAWRDLRSEFDPLVRSIGFRHRLAADDVDDLSQRVWLRLYQNAASVRDPEALPGWIRTTATREAIRMCSMAGRWTPLAACAADAEPRSQEPDPADELLRSERRRVIRESITHLSARDRELLALLLVEPPLTYEQISRRLGVPVGSIGPTRARCLARLRRMPVIRQVA